jgi:hypothetical protein
VKPKKNYHLFQVRPTLDFVKTRLLPVYCAIPALPGETMKIRKNICHDSEIQRIEPGSSDIK